MQRAFYIHLRVLWGLLSQIDIPSAPDDAMIAAFKQRFGSFEELMQLRHAQHPPITNEDMIERVNALRGYPDSTSNIAKQASRIPESSLRYTLGLLARFGLRAWRPNFAESPYSLYNCAHRFIAIETFRQAVVSKAFESMAVDTTYIDDIEILTLGYDHFVIYRVGGTVKAEEKYLGITQLRAERDTVLARRRTVSVQLARAAALMCFYPDCEVSRRLDEAGRIPKAGFRPCHEPRVHFRR